MAPGTVEHDAWDAKTLEDVGEAFERAGLGGRLDAPAEALIAAARDPRARRTLRRAAEHAGAGSIRALLFSDLADGALAVSGRVARNAALAHVKVYLSHGPQPADAREPAPAGGTPSLPRTKNGGPATSEDALVAWAQAHGIAHRLDELLEASAGGLSYLNYWLCALTFRDALVEGRSRALDTSAPRTVQHLRSSCWTLLEEACESARRARDQEPALLARWVLALAIATPVVSGLSRGLLAARATLRESVHPRTFDSFSREHSIDLRQLLLRHVEHAALRGPDGQTRRPEVVLSLEDACARSCSCSPDRPARCAHALAAIDLLLESLLGGPWSAGLQQALDRLAKPRWERAIEDLDAIFAAGAAPVEREVAAGLHWIVSDDGGRITLFPMLERQGKNGRPLAPRPADLAVLAQRPSLSSHPSDHAAIAVLCTERAGLDATHTQGSGRASEYASRRALLALAGHPRVLAAGRPDTVGIEVVREVLQLEGRDEAGGITLFASMGGAPIPPAVHERLSAPLPAGVLVHLDRAARRCVVAEVSEDQRRVLHTFGPAGHHVPGERRDEVVRRLPALERRVALVRPPSLRGAKVEADPAPFFRIEPLPDGEGLSVELRVKPLRGGPSYSPGAGPVEVLGTDEGSLVYAFRDLEREERMAKALTATFAPLDGEGGPSWRLAADEALQLISDLEARTDVVVEWPDPDRRWRVSRSASARDLSLSVKEARDWFGVEGGLVFDEGTVALAAMLEATRGGKRFVRLRGNEWVAITTSLEAKLRQIDDAAVETRGEVQLGPAAPLILDDLAGELASFDASARWRETVARIGRAQAIDPEPPSALAATLRPYQRDGYRWMARLAGWGAGACLADDMGLGKTVQAIALLLDRRENGPALVLAPTSVGFNWARELARFAPSLKSLMLRDVRPDERASAVAALRDGDVLIASYGLLAREVEVLASRRFGTLVIDEAQAIKNAEADRTKAARRIEADWRLALTGTPIENHLGEMWSIFSVVSPGLLGGKERFTARFGAPGGVRSLARVIRPFVLRRTKAEVATDLPAKTEVQIEVELSKPERTLYEAERMVAVAELARVEETLPEEQQRFSVLAALTRLRQLACHPRLVDHGSGVRSSKLARLLELVLELREEGHKALVFSQFTQHLALVEAALQEADVSYEYLDGQTPARERARRVDAFQEGSATVFLLSLRAGGTGLNLTAADYVIHLDPWWNPSVEDQATDRAHRIGQTRPVTVYRLVSKGTIEDEILALHAEKRALVSDVLEGTDLAGKVSTQELMTMIRRGGLGAAPGDDMPSSPPQPATAPHPAKAQIPKVLARDLAELEELAVVFVDRLEDEVDAGRLKRSSAATYRRSVWRLVESISKPGLDAGASWEQVNQRARVAGVNLTALARFRAFVEEAPRR